MTDYAPFPGLIVFVVGFLLVLAIGLAIRHQGQK